MAEAGRWEHRRRARRRALQALYQWQLAGGEASAIIGQFQESQDFDGVDADLFASLVTGVVSGHQDLERTLVDSLDRPLAMCDVMERVILLMGAWQLCHDPRTPPPVVLEESVELAQRFGSDQSPGFVNGVLDHLARHLADAPEGGG